MADTSTSPSTEAPDGKSGTQGAPDGTKTKETEKTEKGSKESDTVTLTREEHEELIARRDGGNAKARRLEEEFASYKETTSKELKDLKDSLKNTKESERKLAEVEAEKSGDIERLKTSFGERETEYQTRITELETQLAEAQGSLTTFQTEVKRSNLRRLATDAAARFSDWTDDVLAPHNFDLEKEFEEVDGRLRVRETGEDPSAYMKKKLSKLGKNHLLRNEALAGTGAAQNSGDTSGSSEFMTLEQVQAMPDGGKEYLRNPKAAAALFGKKKLGK